MWRRKLAAVLSVPMILLAVWPAWAGSRELRERRLGDYRTLIEVYEELWSVAELRPDLVQLKKIGHSADGYPIYLCVLGEDDGQKPAVLYTANIHGGECTAGQMALALLRYLVEGEGKDERVTRLVHEVSIWIVPLLNPDGYFKTTNEQLTYGACLFWRKNGNNVDLNRNFPFDPAFRSWDPRAGNDWLELSFHYRGKYPLSEPETQALQREVLDKRRFDIALGYHTEGGLIIYPWGRQPEPCPDVETFRQIGEAYRSRQPHLPYDVIQNYKWYPVIGSLNDYLYEQYGTFSFTIELGRPDPLEAPGLQKLSLFWFTNVRDLPREIENNLEASVHVAEWALQVHEKKSSPGKEE